MKQILQSLEGHPTLADVPIPAASGVALVVETRATVVSAGTERMLVEFGKSSLLAKARQQPEKVRQVLDKVRTDGLAPTIEAVRAKLASPIPLGYCHAGIVRDVGSRARQFAVGTRVVTNGPHAEFVSVPWTLAARIPEGVSFEAAAFTPLAAIGLQGVRLAAPTLGETVVVYGLGLIGLLTVQLARAAGCRVVGIDPVGDRRDRARAMGADILSTDDPAILPEAVRELTGGVGADVVLLTLSTSSDEPLHLAAEMSRKRGRLVLVGVSGLNLRRADFYKKELSLQVSCSYGPGRYDAEHEQHGVDYPLAFVRWTEGRNFAAVLRLMEEGRLDPLPLVTHRFPFADALSAYELVTSSDPGLGILLQYPEHDAGTLATGRLVERCAVTPRGSAGVVGCIGAGNFASRMLIPAFAKAGAALRTIVSSGGVSGAIAGSAHNFARVASETDAVLGDSSIDIAVIATRHDSHASLVLDALRAGKHVFVEKPLALREDEIDAIEHALATNGRLLAVGFNRRYAPLTLEARRALGSRVGPLAVVMTVNAGALPDDHWTRHPEIGGGRIIGEGCHFIDLARCLVGHPILDVEVVAARTSNAPSVEDVSSIHVRFDDGSWAAIHYLANGNRQFPKERVELFWDGKTVRIDNFRRLEGWGVPSQGRWLGGRQDKGHQALVEAFVRAVREGTAPPIPSAELFEVSRWAIRAGRAAAGLRT